MIQVANIYRAGLKNVHAPYMANATAPCTIRVTTKLRPGVGKGSSCNCNAMKFGRFPTRFATVRIDMNRLSCSD